MLSNWTLHRGQVRPIQYFTFPRPQEPAGTVTDILRINRTHILRVQTNMESPEQTLVRAMARIDGAAQLMREADCTNIEDLKEQLLEMKSQLHAKTELCNKLQLALTELLAKDSNTGRSLPLTSTSAVRINSVSSEHLIAVLSQFKNQVWFSSKPPKLIDALFIKVSSRITDSITHGERTTALTFEECVELVENEVRIKWEEQMPPAISSFVAMEIRVYQSHNAAVTKTDGKICEPVHLLVYMIRKLHNHITHFVFNLRKSHEKKIGKGIFNLESLEEKKSDDDQKEERLKWQDNPIHNEEFESVHEASRKASDCMMNVEECTLALNASITKLASKPVLAELIRHISSVVSLQRKAASEGWNIPRKFVTFYLADCNRILPR